MKARIILLTLVLSTSLLAQQRHEFSRDTEYNFLKFTWTAPDFVDHYTCYIRTDTSIVAYKIDIKEIKVSLSDFPDSSVVYFTATKDNLVSIPSELQEILFVTDSQPVEPQPFESYFITGEELEAELQPGGTWNYTSNKGTYQYKESGNGLYLWRNLGPITIYKNHSLPTSGVYTFTMRGFVWAGGIVHLVVDGDTTSVSWHIRPQTVTYRIPIEAGTKRIEIIPINRPILIEFLSITQEGAPPQVSGIQLELVK